MEISVPPISMDVDTRLELTQPTPSYGLDAGATSGLIHQGGLAEEFGLEHPSASGGALGLPLDIGSGGPAGVEEVPVGEGLAPIAEEEEGLTADAPFTADAVTGSAWMEPLALPPPEEDTEVLLDLEQWEQEAIAQQQQLLDQMVLLPDPGDVPTEAVQNAVDQADEQMPQEPAKVIPLIFWGYSPPVNDYIEVVDEQGELVLVEGAQLIFEKELFENVDQGGRQNFNFYWHSYDDVLKEITATVDTNAAIGTEMKWIKGDEERPPRLVFRGSGDGASFVGNVIFGTYNRLVVDVLKNGKRVRYLLTDEKNPACNVCRPGDFIPELGDASQTINALHIPGRPGASSALDYSFDIAYRSDRKTTGITGVQWDHANYERLEFMIDVSLDYP
jgi:hypothetical protein